MYIPVGWRQICIGNDSNAEPITIEVPRYYGKNRTDLSQYAMYLKTVSEGGRDDILLTPESGEETLTAVWTPSPPQTSYAGPLFLQLRFEGENFKWETPISQIEILPSADALPAVPATPSAYEGWLQNVQTAANSVLDMTVSAESLPSGSSASVEKTLGEGVFNLNFGIPRGAMGNGIASISKTGTSGNVDTYTITYTDETTTTFTVTNGDTETTVTPRMRWETGTISSSGTRSDSTNTKRMRYCDFVQIRANEFVLNVPTGYIARYSIYNAEKTFQSQSSNVRETSVTVSITSGWYIKLSAWNTSGTAVSPAEGGKITVSFRGNALNPQNAIAENPQDYTSMAMFRNIAVVGDSLASGSLHTPGYDSQYVTTAYDLSWIQIIARRNGITATNFSKGGLNTKTWLEYTDRGLPALLAADPQNLYIIALGINDKTSIDAGTMTLGTIADVNVSDYTQNPDTFYGNYGRIIGNILTHAPKAKIVCLSVAREGERAMDEHIEAIAEKYEIPFVDLTEDAYFTSELYYSSFADGHPLAYGYAGMGRVIEKLLQKSVINNVEYFADYYGLTS